VVFEKKIKYNQEIMKEELTSEQKIGFQRRFLLASEGGQLLR
jgi:hypothetical protein